MQSEQGYWFEGGGGVVPKQAGCKYQCKHRDSPHVCVPPCDLGVPQEVQRAGAGSQEDPRELPEEEKQPEASYLILYCVD